jgi:hypothetical protein
MDYCGLIAGQYQTISLVVIGGKSDVYGRRIAKSLSRTG